MSLNEFLLDEGYEEAITIDGCDKAFIGITTRGGCLLLREAGRGARHDRTGSR